MTHANAFTLARRLTEKNENDLMMEDFVDGKENGTKVYTETFCHQLVSKVTPNSPLPEDCQKFPTVVKKLQRRNSDKSDHAKAFAGMSPGDMANATIARERGGLSHAQIQRRLTTSRK